MRKLLFRSNDRPTLGIEVELGLVDAETHALANRCACLLEEVPETVRGSCKPELMQCCVEVITGVCDTVADAETDLRRSITALQSACDNLGLKLWWGSTHPFSDWRVQQPTPDDRYSQLLELLQEMARRLLTFGLHVHVGVDSGDKAVMICDRIMQHLPAMLALTCSSPYWEGRDTGLHSYRSKIMEGLPTAGLPTLMRNWSEYVWLVHHMIDTEFINTIREIWWDVRPHHNFGTVEVRVCDMPGRLDDVLAIAAYIQCLVAALSDRIDEGAYQHDCHPMMVRQNKWRAARYGRKARLVNSYTYKVQSVADQVGAIIKDLAPVGERLGCLDYLQRIPEMARSPSSAERQAEILEATGDPREIVRRLCEESRVV